MPKGVARGKSKGKTVARSGPTSMPTPPSHKNIEKWKEGDTFSSVMAEYSHYSTRNMKLTPKKQERLFHALYYYDDEAEAVPHIESSESNMKEND